jgi:hypothetical protein
MADRARFSTRITLNELIKGRGPYRIADVLGAGGGLALAGVLEGFQFAAKREDRAGAGVALMAVNRAVLGATWNVQATDPGNWRGVTADVVTSVARTEDEAAVLLTYAARLRPAVVVLDSVPDVFAGHAMARTLNKGAGLGTYRSTAVTYNDLSLGGALDRRRQFTVLHQVPFGVDRVALDWLAVGDDAVRDLLELEPTWKPQPLYRAPTWYSRALRAPDHTVDGFMPPVPEYRAPSEWAWARPGVMPVPSVRGLFRIRGRDDHPITHREIARLMGFPDVYRLGTATRGLRDTHLGAYWEVTTSMHPARWVMRWVHRSLDGHAGPLRGDVDVSEDWRPLADRQWGGRGP